MNKLTKKSQQRIYAFSGLGVNMLNLMMGSYLCSALLTGGFKDADIANQTFVGKDLVIAAVWSVFVLIAKIIDGVIDIPMASFTDRLKTRWGRRRPSIIIGMIPMVISYLLFLVVPNPGGATLLNTIYYFVMLCVFYSSYTLTMVTYYATFTEIVDTEEERNRISTTKSVFDIVYFILGYVAVRMLLNGLNVRIVAIIVLPLVLTMLIPLFMIKEDNALSKRSEKDGKQQLRTVGLTASFKATFKNTTFIKWLIVNALMTIGVQLFLSGINEYFSTAGMSMIYVMLAAFVPVPFTLMIYNRLIKKYGFGTAFRYTLIMFTVSTLAMFGVGLLKLSPVKTGLSVAAGLIASFAIGALFSVSYSVPSQLAAEEQDKSGVSNSAMYFAVQGLFQGAATGIAQGVILTLLKKTPISLSLAEINGDATGQGSAVFYMTLICAIFTLAALALTWWLPKSIMKMGQKEIKG